MNAMKYCVNCNHITPLEPLFCQYCARTYDVKLCPRMHPNPRSAEVCSRCGSRDLSTPQPRVPFWVPFAEFFLSLIPGTLLGLGSIVTGFVVISAIITRPDMIIVLVIVTIPFGILWAMWSEIPRWFRTQIYKMLKRRRDRDTRREG